MKFFWKNRMFQPKWSKKAFSAIKILPPKNCPPKKFGWCPPPPKPNSRYATARSNPVPPRERSLVPVASIRFAKGSIRFARFDLFFKKFRFDSIRFTLVFDSIRSIRFDFGQMTDFFDSIRFDFFSSRKQVFLLDSSQFGSNWPFSGMHATQETWELSGDWNLCDFLQSKIYDRRFDSISISVDDRFDSIRFRPMIDSFDSIRFDFGPMTDFFDSIRFDPIRFDSIRIESTVPWSLSDRHSLVEWTKKTVSVEF